MKDCLLLEGEKGRELILVDRGGALNITICHNDSIGTSAQIVMTYTDAQEILDFIVDFIKEED